MMGNDMCCVRNCLLSISTAHIFVCLYVGFFLVKHTRCIWCCRFLNVMDRRKNLILYFNQFFCFFYGFQIFCCHQSDGIPEIMRQPTDRNQRILVVFDVTDFVLTRNIIGRKDANHTRKCFCSCGIDGKHSRSWIFTAKCRTVTHIFQNKVIRIFSVSQNFFFHIQSVHA